MADQPRTIQSSRDLGAFIYDARTQRHLTQEALANKANVSRSWLIGLEQGKRPRAEMDKILSLLEALDISLSLQMLQDHETASKNQIPQGNSAKEISEHKTPSPASQNTSSDSIPAPWESLIGDTFKNVISSHLGANQYLRKYLSDQAAQSLKNAKIFEDVKGTNMSHITKAIGANTMDIEKMMSLNIPNFGQASGISKALDYKERENKIADPE